jgi:NAD(P)-dependent dehydrogenase (short-subunit alcohol dehydrogenase family)
MDETMLMTGASRGIGWHAAVAMLAANPQLRMFVTDRTGGLTEALRDKSGTRRCTAYQLICRRWTRSAPPPTT